MQPMNKRQQFVKITLGNILKEGLAQLELQNNLVEELLQQTVLSDKAVFYLISVQQRGDLCAHKMEPVDLRSVLGIVGIDLRLRRAIKDDISGRDHLPVSFQEEMAAALVNVEQLVIQASGGTLDGKIFGHEVLIATAIYKKRFFCIFKINRASGISRMSCNSNHNTPSLKKVCMDCDALMRQKQKFPYE